MTNVAEISSEPRLPLSRPARWLSLAFAAIIGATAITYADGLVDRAPATYAIVVALLGFSCGAYFVYRTQDRLMAQGTRGYLAVFGVPLLTLFIAARLGRFVLEMIAFVGMAPTERHILAPVIDMSSGKSGWHATVKIDPQSRDLWIAVTDGLYAQLDAFRHPARDCLALTMQTGRFGIRRVLMPGFFGSVDVNQLRSCPPCRRRLGQWRGRSTMTNPCCV